ncbi:M48 family metalloprotease [Fervidibacter sacchari]|uniref:Zn-dependent protease with chaperone function n=1 Tax=Candidatus Fervidibacter sacchari TaxID=1448929 RepID=A0ABT2EMG6_9BACT|nr:M48 family metalloprotease [Candidatus Fervidibacter sacchari]MCS3919050.1 Zn-dependent protease with chaperone function [Candidatus Fervidibacter sacchari]WKU17217.1 M48 family metalloprotease [Candidatus Fervidibacter sacchari]
MAHRMAILSLLTLFTLVPAFPQLILIGRNQEIEIGKEVAAALEKQYGVWDDPEQTRRIERIGKSLVAVCERKDMPYTFKILNERKELNAMAAPGGFIYITRALLEALESDDEVAFVLGHEIGHVAGDHIRKQLSQAIAGSILLDILTGGSSQLVRIGADIMFSLYQSGYSRQHERDADTRGVRYMKAAGYNPVAAITALKKLGMERYKGLVRWFGTHPDIPSRIQRIADMLGVDPETLQPLPQGAKSGALPKRSAALVYLSENAVFRLSPDSSQPQKVWQLKNQRVEKFQVSNDGKTLWMLVRREGSELVQLAIRKEGNRKTEFPNAFHADEIHDFQRSPNGRWLAVLAKESGKTFLKVFDGKGKELALPDRTPLGEIIAIQWTHDDKLLVFAERFGEPTLAIWSFGDTFRFVSMSDKTQPSQTAANERKIFVLTGTTLKQGEIGQEFVSWRPVASSVSAFAVNGENIALVKDGVLQLGTLKGQELQLSVLDNRKGEFGDLTFSRDGQWLAYTYRAKTSDQPQLWLAHVPTKQLWRIAVNATSPVFAGR